MGVGVFGKLPAKRDFVQYEMSTDFMSVFDPWLQSAVAQSRDQLGNDWLESYLRAPIWRFWLGRQVTGRSTIGVLMPSVDGVGRYFPLCLAEEHDTAIAPPEINAQEAWFDAAEALILAALADDATYEDLLGGVKGLPATDGAVEQTGVQDGISEAFSALRCQQFDAFYGHLSCWWVRGAPESAGSARAAVYRGLPSPVEYASMLESGQPRELAQETGGA